MSDIIVSKSVTHDVALKTTDYSKSAIKNITVSGYFVKAGTYCFASIFLSNSDNITSLSFIVDDQTYDIPVTMHLIDLFLNATALDILYSLYDIIQVAPSSFRSRPPEADTSSNSTGKADGDTFQNIESMLQNLAAHYIESMLQILAAHS